MVGIGFVHPCIQLQIGVKLLGCREYANQEALQVEANDNEQLFICLIQPRLGVGGYYTLHNFWLHEHNLYSMGGHGRAHVMLWAGMGEHGWAHLMLWVGMGGHRSLLMVMVWVWVQIRRKMLGSGPHDPMIRRALQTLLAPFNRAYMIDCNQISPKKLRVKRDGISSTLYMILHKYNQTCVSLGVRTGERSF
jgi:hypothetical protein